MFTASNSTKVLVLVTSLLNIVIFLPRDAMHKRGLCRHAVSVCLSVRPSVTFVDHVKTNNISSKFFYRKGSHTILVFTYQRGCRYSDGNPLMGRRMQGGMKK